MTDDPYVEFPVKEYPDPMPLEQESHLHEIKESFLTEVDRKYRAGQREHGGCLWRKPQADNLIDEATDLFTYAQANREHWRDLRRLALAGDMEGLRRRVLEWTNNT